MEAIYYWVGVVIVWLIMIPVASVGVVMGWVFLHKDLMKKYKWYRQGIEWQLLPLYVLLAMGKGQAAQLFIGKINKFEYRQSTHLRVLIGLLNHLHSLRKP